MPGGFLITHISKYLIYIELKEQPSVVTILLSWNKFKESNYWYFLKSTLSETFCECVQEI